MITVLLVDDHAVVRAGLKALLESTGHIDVVGEASSGEEAVERVRALEPDVTIMDLAMSGTDGVQATRQITALGVDTKVLVLTIHEEDEFLVPSLCAGAVAFLNKSAADTELVGAIDAVVRGHSYLPATAAALLGRHKRQEASSSVGPGPDVLSPRERAVIRLYAMGFTAAATGRKEFLSPKTVEGYIARAKSKLGLKSRRELVRFALEAGLLQEDGER